MGEHQDIEAPAPIGVVGAGTMGAGVAQCFAQAGRPVVVVDPHEAARRDGAARLRSGMRLRRLLGGGGDTSPADAAPVEFSAELGDLAQASFVVECAREREPLKEEILRELDRVCGPDTILASCTSAIPIARLASFTGRPDRVIGTHFMNPAPVKDAVEVACSARTSEETLRRTRDLLAAIGKKPVVVGDGPGFVTNRVLMLTINEAAAVLDQGTADAETVDRVFRECFGHPMGPLRTGDLIGLDTVVDTLDVLRTHTGDARFRPYPLLAGLVADGRVGRKAGRGFHSYPQSPLVARGETSHG
ncbi:3-hydroxyacyl-CoA dehydrogenase family protein [Streptomyces sp. DSM 42041]|uniref:3-hydroxyacyl-CoA dehydrogenase family protein n=2 Tax=Streptomyces hazeniae TaxID=3075538 RepID=A0ABU2NKM0_9ACTN|nr:3-hydroxyacyl-CoA dehydrogenase family protein [Streptomyces sp. DSM 42041]MDT0377534.1 3-hydroxyacyl-CoA dehydrogenase family protein [Streptomyces sp. DSM 42041]